MDSDASCGCSTASTDSSEQRAWLVFAALLGATLRRRPRNRGSITEP
ncbi:MAG: MYXO-CTERM sorting domain-containing protein [Myxococcota bacterium]